MIRVDKSGLDPGRSFAMDRLVDCSRVLRVVEDQADVVQLSVAPEGSLTAKDPVAEADAGFEMGDGTLRVSMELLDGVLQMVSAESEQKSAQRDGHGRVPPGENALVQRDAAADPIVSRWAAQLARSASEAAGNRLFRLAAPYPEWKRWGAAVTHDLDVAGLWPLATAARLAELGRKGSFATAVRTIGGAISGITSNPVWEGIKRLLKEEEARGVRATWFVMAGDPSLGSIASADITYSLTDSLPRKILSRLREHGHEIGLHGSFDTTEDAALFETQRGELASAARTSVSGVRQHFLKYRLPVTQRSQQEAGFEYDASCGFNDRNGFRLGLADVTPTWDTKAARRIDLELVPLMWMDRSLSKHAGIEDPKRWVDEAITLAEECEAVEGLWVGLWHPNMTTALGYPGAEQQIPRLLDHLHDRGAFIAPVGEIVSWRKARREVFVDKIAEDGRFQLRSKGGVGYGRIPTEAYDGTTQENHAVIGST